MKHRHFPRNFRPFPLRHTLLLAAVVTLVSCEKLLTAPDTDSTPTSTFEYLWQKVDQQYAFFDVKEVDWQQVHDLYAPMVGDGMGSDSLFNVLASMLNHLDDGHVNLVAPYDVSRSEEVYTRMYERRQIDSRIVALHYLGPRYHSTGGFQHQAIADGRVVYVRYSSFSNSASTSQLDHIVRQYPEAEGLILDMRQNGGGSINNIWKILSLFDPQGESRPLLYRTQIKSGPGHGDFTPLEEVYAPEIDSRYTPYHKPVVVLTDRGSYSATSFFALCCRAYPNIVTMGDTTGGGLGLPNGGQLPNGWYYRFSVTRTLAPDGRNFENGVPPDRLVLLDTALTTRDNIIDSAAQMIIDNR